MRMIEDEGSNAASRVGTELDDGKVFRILGKCLMRGGDALVRMRRRKDLNVVFAGEFSERRPDRTSASC
jgi:hypothetical protein